MVLSEKISRDTKDIFVEVTSNKDMGTCKKVADALLVEMLNRGVCSTKEGNNTPVQGFVFLSFKKNNTLHWNPAITWSSGSISPTPLHTQPRYIHVRSAICLLNVHYFSPSVIIELINLSIGQVNTVVVVKLLL